MFLEEKNNWHCNGNNVGNGSCCLWEAGNTDKTVEVTFDKNSEEYQLMKNGSCLNCHGQNLEGLSGPRLDKIGDTLSKEDILDAIENGRRGMPKGLLKGEEAEKVAQWLSELK